MRPDEFPLLADFLYLAIHVPPGEQPPPRNIVEAPELALYISDFGRRGDVAIVAEDDGHLIGAAWTRLFPEDNPAYGTIDAHTPDLAVAVQPECRGTGIGTAILKSLFQALTDAGYERVSLSVQRSNPAADLYRRLGFVTYREDDAEYFMLMPLDKKR